MLGITRSCRPVVLLAVLAVALAGLLPATASAAAAEPTTLGLAAPARYGHQVTTLTVTLRSGGAALPGAPVTLQRYDGTQWEPLGAGPVVTDDSGTATVELVVSRSPAANLVRAAYEGDPEHEPATAQYRLPLRLQPTTTTLTGPSRVIDEQSARMRITWRTSAGDPVAGRVSLQRRSGDRWLAVRTLVTGESGVVSFDLVARSDSRWRALSLGTPWAAKSVSAVHTIDNLPAGVPVRLPAGAPRPRLSLPAQPRATIAGAAPRISRIPDAVWRSMVGRSWHRGCPVGRSGLRLLRINYWDYTGYRRQGEVVAAASVVRQIAAALTDLYRAKIPIRSMYRVDRFGWSRRLQGADDYASMAAGNTSAFNCRWVVGRPGVRSPHSYGRSLDVNPWENPYRSRQGWVPNAWWPGHSHARIAWRSRSHVVVRTMAGRGLRWTYGRSDLHHFDAVPRGSRPIVPPGCADQVCH